MSKKKNDKGAGRPSKLNAEIQAMILHDIEGGLGQDESAARNGIHRETLRKWIKNKPAFCAAIEKARAQFEHDNLLIIRNASVNQVSRDGNTMLRRGSWQAAAWILERRMSDKYGLRWHGEVAGKGGKPLIPESGPKVDTSRFTKEQLDALIVATNLMITNTKSADVPANGSGNGNGTAPHP